MSSPVSQESGSFKEWAPLTNLLQKIPSKIQIGLFPQDINITCIDVVPEFLAIGTNYGFVYWYDRKSGKIETLGCENVNSSITCVKIVSTVDYMVSAGNNEGGVTIFQIPKEIPDSLPEIFKPKKKKQVERFNVSGLHKIAVTALEWSKNGMKLFSGDQNGLVVLTEIDFNLHLSKSTDLLNEKYSVVQLSYHNGLLLISTLFRTIIVDRNSNNQVTQVGQKERKMLGKLGAVFFKNKNHIQEPKIYTTRPGLRIWQADKNGTVLKTLILKEAVRLEQNRVELLNPAARISKFKNREANFGIIMPFSDDLLITFNEDMIYIVNPTEIKMVATVSDLRKITDVACFDEEIFIIEGERNIVRIASYPDIGFSDTDEPVELSTILSESFNNVTLGFSELTSKIKQSPIVPVINKINPSDLMKSTSILPSIVTGLDVNSVIHAEEAVEVPPIIPLDLETPLVTKIDGSKKHFYNGIMGKTINSIDREDIFQKIAEQDFEEVVFIPKKKEKDVEYNLMHVKQLNQEKIVVNNHDRNSNDLSQLNRDFEINSDKQLDVIEKAVQDKEKLLSTYLELDLSKYKDKNKTSTSKSNFYFSSRDDAKDLSEHWSNYETIKLEKMESIEAEKSEEHYSDKLTATTAIKFNETFEKNSNDSKNIQSKQEKFHLEENKISEIHFNALSKEFVKSTIHQDNDDWVLLG